MNTLKQIAAAVFMTAGIAGSSLAATVGPLDFTAPDNFSGFGVTAGEEVVLDFNIVLAGDYLVEITPSPSASTAGWSAWVGSNVLSAVGNTLRGVFSFAVGDDYELYIKAPSGTNVTNYSFSGVIESVPAPGTLALLGIGFAGLGLVRRKQNS